MIIKTKILNRTNILGITIWPFIFVRPNVSKETINHEKIHLEQQKELLVIGFYGLYLYWNLKYGYHKNPLEVEAFRNEKFLNYISIRKKFNYV